MKTTKDIPKKYYQEIYDQHISGATTIQIVRSLKQLHNITVSPQTVNRLLVSIDENITGPTIQGHVMDNIETTHQQISDLYNELNNKLISHKNSDKLIDFLKICDRLIKIFNLKLMSNAFNKQFDNLLIDQQAKEQFTDSLKKIIDQQTAPAEDKKDAS